jgi:hypothetical protein
MIQPENIWLNNTLENVNIKGNVIKFQVCIYICMYGVTTFRAGSRYAGQDFNPNLHNTKQSATYLTATIKN